jgi:glycosyltransferase involved in cell wall biosynthesis
MKRIAFYCSSISWGGLEMNFVRYAQWLAERGHTVHVYCVDASPIHQHVLKSNLSHTSVAHNRKYADIINAWKVSKLIKSFKAEIIWFRDTRDMSILGLVKMMLGGKPQLIYQQAMQLGVDKKDILHTMRFNRIDTWIATLDFLKQQVLTRTHFSEKKLHVIPLGVDASLLQTNLPNKSACREQLCLPEDKLLVGVIGRIDPLKGQHIAINAIQLCPEHVHLVIMGESTKNEGNEYEHELKKKVRSLGLEKRVHFRPYSSNVGPFYQSLDIFAMTSKGETFGTVTIEAMSFALPAIGTDSSGTPEILNFGKAGLLFEPENALELSEHIKTLASSEAERKQWGERAQKRFQQLFSKEASLQAIARILQ